MPRAVPRDGPTDGPTGCSTLVAAYGVARERGHHTIRTKLHARRALEIALAFGIGSERAF